MILVTSKPPVRLLTTKKRQLSVDKRIIMNKGINVLASGQIMYPVNPSSYMSIDIPQVSLLAEENDRMNGEYIVSFEDINTLNTLKVHMKHPYCLSTVKVSDISYYLERAKCNLMIIRKSNPLADDPYTAYTISFEELGNPCIVRISSIGFRFTEKPM